MHWTSCLIICLAQILSCTFANNGKYTIIAPGTIYSNGKYTAAVAVHQTNESCQVKIGIKGPFYNETTQVDVSQNEVKHVEFNLPILEKGDYELTAEGVNCLDNFKNTTKLLYNIFTNRAEILTDKNLYRPGDYVHYRVLFFGKDMIPVEPERDAVIWFEDGKRNRIKEIKGFKTIKGVYTGKYKIAEVPIMGVWSLGVKNGNGFKAATRFTVKKYILPKYLVEIEAPNCLVTKDYMPVVIRANYNNGRPLVGKVAATLYLIALETPPLTKIFNLVNGIVEFDFALKEFGDSPEFGIDHLIMEITVEEHFTGNKEVNKKRILVSPYRYSIYCLGKNCNLFKAGKELDVEFMVTNLDRTIPKNTNSTVELIYKEELHKEKAEDTNLTSPMVENRTLTFKGNLDVNGCIHFKVVLPDLPEYKGYKHFYAWRLFFAGESTEGDIYQLRKPNNIEVPQEEIERPREYFVLEKDPWDLLMYVNTPVQFTLNSSQPLSYIDYSIIARGNILESGHIDLPNKPLVYNLTLTAEFSWLENVKIYVYYVDEKGDYHYLQWKMGVKIAKDTEELSITAPKLVKPGEEVALKIKSTNNSFVGILAVDFKGLLGKNTNSDGIGLYYKHLSAYDTRTPPQGGYGDYPGLSSGCVTLTNAHYLYSRKNPRSRYSKSRSIRSPMANAFKHIPDEKYGTTWIFADIENTEASEFTWSIKIPNSVTSWYAKAFSMNPTEGYRATKGLAKITAFRSFDVSVNLPYSVKRGEIINVPATVSNYLDQPLNIVVTMHNSDNEYEFVEFDYKTTSEQKRSKSIWVSAKSAADVFFLLKPKIIGNVMLKITANSTEDHDVIHKPLRVVAEGITQFANLNFFINLQNDSEISPFVGLKMPIDYVSDTEHVKVCVTNDILGPVLDDLDNLVQLPAGCGEQTLSTLMINYLIMKHLKNSKRLTPIMETKLQYNLETGIQNILHYRHRDGSFSNFGPPGDSSTWLTAYAMHSLLQIRELVYVDDKFIEEGINYLVKQQVENGAFVENDGYFSGSQNKHVALTCAAVLAILENSIFTEKYSYELHKGLEFIVKNTDTLDSLSNQALVTYTLNKAQHGVAKKHILKLKAVAKTESDHMWWSSGFNNNVEITSYALLTLLDQESTKVDDVVPIIKWLIEQRNIYGGFNSMQDTVNGLSALIKFAQFAANESAKMSVEFESNNKTKIEQLTDDNEFLDQTVDIPINTSYIEINAKGTGYALVQISYEYKTFEKDSSSAFSIKTTRIDNKSLRSHFVMSVCVNYVGETESSTMAFLKISTPSGFVIYQEVLNDINVLKEVGNTELKNDNSLLIVYFDKLYKNEEICLRLEAWRTHLVALQKPAIIELYDYHNTKERAAAIYEIGSELCDICVTEEECNKCI